MQREEMTLGVERELRVGEMVAGLVVGQKTFRPRRHPAHRTAEPPRRPGDEPLLGIELALVAEAAAHIGRDHAQRALRHAELLGHLLADVVRRLGRAHQREPVGAGLDRREHRPRLDRRADQAVVDEIDGDLVRRRLERGAHRRLVAARPAEADVAGRGLVQLRRARRLRGARVGDRGERLVVDGDTLGGVSRRIARLGDHRHHRLAHMAYRAARQRVARRLRHRVSVARTDDPERPHRQDAIRRHVGAGEHRDDAGRGGRRRHVDAANARMGVRRAHEHAFERAGRSMSATNFPRPSRKRRSSTRRSGAPMPWSLPTRRRYCISSRTRSSRSNADLSVTMNRSASPPLASWRAKVQCGMVKTSCCDHSKRLLADGRAALARDHETDHVVGRALGAGRRALAQARGVAVERRHDGAAGRRIDVADHARAVGAGRRGGEQPARGLARVAVFRRIDRARGGAFGEEPGLGPQPLVALVDLPELVAARIARLEEMRVDRADERHVGGVEPDDAVIALVDVAVPAHRRRQDQVAVLHLAAAAVDDGGGAVGAGGETDGGAGVAVRTGAVARLQHREGGEHRAGGGGFARRRPDAP